MNPTKTLVAAALATMVALPAAAEELKFASFVPPQHTVTKSLIDKLATDVKAKTGGERFAACVLLADSRLDVNRVVRKRLEARRVSFASADETRELTGMEIGGVTPICLPEDLPLWIDNRVMQADYIILGGGNRSSKIKISPRIFDQLSSSIVIDGLAKLPSPEA